MQIISPSKSFTKQDWRDRALKDNEFFNKELFPTAFYIDSDDVHRKIDDMIWSRHKFVSVIAPRKIGKTPRICFSYPIKNIVYNLQSYIVVTSATISESERHITKIVRALETNEKIHYYFGQLVDRRNKETTKDSVQFTNGIWLRSKGLRSQFRGTGGEWTPPSLIIVDDPQSNKDVKSDTSLKNAKNWFNDEVIYSIAKKWRHTHHNKIYYGKVRFLGTSLHPQCLAEVVDADARFHSIRFSMLQNEAGEPDMVKGRSIWEAMFSTSELYTEMQAADDSGVLGNWLQERMNMPYKYGDRIFKPDDTRYWDIGNNRFDVVQGLPVFVMEEDLGIAISN